MAPAAWSYYGPTVLEEINSVGGEVAEDFYRRLYEVLKRPRNAPRVMLTKNRPAEYTVPFDAALLTYTLVPDWPLDPRLGSCERCSEALPNPHKAADNPRNQDPILTHQLGLKTSCQRSPCHS